MNRLCVLLLTIAGLTAADDDAPFPFAVAWDDSSSSVIDGSHLVSAPVSGRLRVRDGHLVDETGKRARFLGVNLVAGACFPEAVDAPIIARRLRRLGVTCARLHHMDSAWAKPNLFSLDGGVAERPCPESLARLDGLIAALAAQGIRVDLNLHVGRIYGPELGYPKLTERNDVSSHGKAVGFFDERAIVLQKQFARDLLGRVNPLRGMRLADDPVLALVELVNEDTLVGAAALLPGLPEPWQGQLRSRWNAFLLTRYGTTEALLAAWNHQIRPTGEDLLGDGRFADGMGKWLLEQHHPATAEYGIEDPAGATDRPTGRVLRISPTSVGNTDWHLQVNRPGLTLVPGETYTLSFAARAAAPRTINVNARMNQAPWDKLGLDALVRLDPAWRSYSFTFTAALSAGANNRVGFIVGNHPAEIFLADLTLKPGGGGVTLTAQQRLETASVPLVELSPSPAGRDLAAFLIATEEAFCQDLRRFVRDELKCPAPVLASQASYGGVAGLRRESCLDLVDMHAYWQHPSFPGRSWDMNDFRIENTPMVAATDGGALLRVAQYRAAGLPFIVSEYDHPAPSEYCAEAVPLAFAVAARQDWDGIFLFDYLATSAPSMREPRISSFFSNAQHPAKLAFFPIAAEMFLAEAMPVASGRATLDLPEALVEELTANRVGNGFWRLAGSQNDALDLLNQRLAVAFTTGTSLSLTIASAATPPAMTWVAGAHPHVRLHAPRVAGAIGLIREQAIDAGALHITAEANPRNFAAVAIASRDARPLTDSGRMLLVAVDKAENSGIRWAADRHSAKDAWSGTTRVTGVSAAVELATTAERLAVWALDGRGVRIAQVPSVLEQGRLRFRIAVSYHTVWYEIAAR